MREFVNRKTILTLGAFWLGAVLSTYLPDTAIDPWGVLAPRRAVTIFLVILGLQWFGAIAKYFLGHVHGTFFSGFLGGFVSSTAIHLVATRSTSHESLRAARCLSATLSSIFLMALVVLLADAALFKLLLGPILSSTFVLIFALIYLGRQKLKHLQNESQAAKKLEAPLTPPRIFDSVKFAALFFSLLLLIGWLKSLLGSDAILYIAVLTSLFELHSFTTSACGLHASGALNTQLASLSLVIALCTSIVAKGALLMMFSRARWVLSVFMTYLASALCAYVVYTIFN